MGGTTFFLWKGQDTPLGIREMCIRGIRRNKVLLASIYLKNGQDKTCSPFDDNIFKNSYTTLSQFSGWTLEKIANLAQNVHLLAANGPGKKRYLCTFVKYFHA